MNIQTAFLKTETSEAVCGLHLAIDKEAKQEYVRATDSSIDV